MGLIETRHQGIGYRSTLVDITFVLGPTEDF